LLYRVKFILMCFSLFLGRISFMCLGLRVCILLLCILMLCFGVWFLVSLRGWFGLLLLLFCVCLLLFLHIELL
jgi:hypothetical protein